MTWDVLSQAFFWGALGSICVEATKTVDKFRRLSNRDFKRIISSSKFYAFVLVVSFVGGIGAIVGTSLNQKLEVASAILSGAGAFGLIEKLDRLGESEVRQRLPRYNFHTGNWETNDGE